MNQIEKVDILAIGAHPDDVELGCSGTLAKYVDKGKSIGILHLTRGELGTRGSAQERDKESLKAAEILKARFMVNIGLADGFFSISEDSLSKVIRIIRMSQPEIIFANSPSDRHPDHGQGSKLVNKANFLSGLRKVTSLDDNGLKLDSWRAKQLYYYIQDRFSVPDFVVDISPFMDIKLASIQAYASQFYDPNSKEPVTPISTPEFFEGITARAREVGHSVKVPYGEGFLCETPLKVNDLFSLV